MALGVAILFLQLFLGAAECEDGLCPMSHLQVHSALHRTTGLNATALEQQGICKTHMSFEDIRTPILQLMAQSPDQDGWCLYGIMGDWASTCALARQTQNMQLYTDEMQQFNLASFRKQRRLVLGSISLALRDYTKPQVDIYCFANGLYNFSQTEVLSSFEQLQTASEQTCKSLEMEMPNYHSLSMFDFFKASAAEELALSSLNGFLASSEPQYVTLDGELLQSMRVQAAVKCLLSSGPGGPALCDLAYCARRGCVNEQNEVRYTALSECPDI